MKKTILSAIVFMGLSLYAAEEERSITFMNKDTKKVMVTIKDRKSGVVLKETSLRPNETFRFPATKRQKYTAQVKEADGDLSTPLYNLFLPARHATGEVSIVPTTPLFRNKKILILVGKNAAVHEPFIKIRWD